MGLGRGFVKNGRNLTAAKPASSKVKFQPTLALSPRAAPSPLASDPRLFFFHLPAVCGL
jgi:hypothetical protein